MKATGIITKYNVILCDAPWDFKVYDVATGSGRNASQHYPTMGLQAICDLPIANLADKNCALFFWTTWPHLFHAQTVIEAWGFKYRTLGFEWWKLNKGWYTYMSNLVGVRNHRLLEAMFHFGMGYYGRANSEPCLLAVKGKMPVAVRDQRNFIISPIRDHSRKPAEQYSKIQALYPKGRYLELFARERQPGWDVFGNEVEGSIELKGMP